MGSSKKSILDCRLTKASLIPTTYCLFASSLSKAFVLSQGIRRFTSVKGVVVKTMRLRIIQKKSDELV